MVVQVWWAEVRQGICVWHWNGRKLYAKRGFVEAEFRAAKEFRAARGAGAGGRDKSVGRLAGMGGVVWREAFLGGDFWQMGDF
jgi:hypothetical protein